ncbi:MAG TPA: alpha/beta hydrolase [Chloroflexia bacterium]|nr:alpha/beta hydrolase [Chloroflexia bacterium]
MTSSFSLSKARTACVLLIAATFLLPPQVGASPQMQASDVKRDVTYCTAGGVALKMDIYSPPANRQAAPAPVVLYVHGGSWISGDKFEVGQAAGELSAKGYLVASVNYRLAPQYRWPAQIEDVKCAVRYLRASAATYSLDPNRIAAWGSSAGGHLVALLGLTGKSAGFEGAGGYADQSSAVQAVVDMFGPTDLTAFNPDRFATGIGDAVFGVKPGGPTDVLVKASPVNYVSASAPPFLILQGDKDTLVPPSQSQLLHDRLVAAGAKSDLVLVKNAGHGFVPSGGPISPSLLEIRSSIESFLDRTVGQTRTRSRVFQETGKPVSGKFLDYWEAHGGLQQQGFPISNEMQEKSEVDGKTYTVQYFERAVFELHPENAPPNDVLLSLLGAGRLREKYPSGTPAQTPNNGPGSVLFPQTGKRLGGGFLSYWTSHGGLAQQGYPLTDEFTEVSDVDGKTYTVQYFERAVFELHPQNKAPYNVLLSLLGSIRLNSRH